MTAPFPEAVIAPFIYMSLGALIITVTGLTLYIRHLHRQIDSGKTVEEPKFRVDNIGLSKKSQDLMEKIMEEPELQSDLPGELGVSKATVSNAVSELKERGLIKRKKRANTYLIEPDTNELGDQQR